MSTLFYTEVQRRPPVSAPLTLTSQQKKLIHEIRQRKGLPQNTSIKVVLDLPSTATGREVYQRLAEINSTNPPPRQKDTFTSTLGADNIAKLAALKNENLHNGSHRPPIRRLLGLPWSATLEDIKKKLEALPPLSSNSQAAEAAHQGTPQRRWMWDEDYHERNKERKS